MRKKGAKQRRKMHFRETHPIIKTMQINKKKVH